MKRKSITVYSIIISIIFVIAIIFLSYNLSFEYITGRKRCAKKFDELVNTTKNTLSKIDDSSIEFQNEFIKACGNFSDYSFITLKKQSQVLFAYPNEKTNQNINNATFYETHTSSFSTGDNVYVITASMYILRPASIFNYARFSFLLILSATLFSFILIIYIHFSNDEDEKSNFDSDIVDKDISDINYDLPIEEKFEEDLPNNNIIINNNTYEPKNNKTVSTSSYEDDYEKPQKPFLEENNTKNIPQGLFSPVSGFGWAQYLEPRLDSELIRAASSELDLSLLLLRIPTLSFTDSIAPKIFKYLSEKFQSNDLLFEYESDAFAIIKENTAIDEAFTIANIVYDDIIKILQDNNIQKKCAIGLSSRSVRMLPGKRLIIEASEALENALNDANSPVIAFKANADKYRKIMENFNQ